MTQSTALMTSRVLAVATLAGGGMAATHIASPAMAAPRAKHSAMYHRCVFHSANGTGATASIAKFQVYEGILKAAGDGLWTSWMATGATPGYVIKAPKYTCKTSSGLGIGCVGRSTVCKL